MSSANSGGAGDTVVALGLVLFTPGSGAAQTLRVELLRSQAFLLARVDRLGRASHVFVPDKRSLYAQRHGLLLYEKNGCSFRRVYPSLSAFSLKVSQPHSINVSVKQ